VLKATAILTPTKAKSIYDEIDDKIYDDIAEALYGATYEVNLPDDYLHILNCVCVYRVLTANNKCLKKDSYVKYGAKRLATDMWGEIINNYYFKPSYKMPYYYIHNINTSTEIPTNPIVLDGDGNIKLGTDYKEEKITPTETYTFKYGFTTTYNGVKNDESSAEITHIGKDTFTIENVSPDSNSTIIYIKVPDELDSVAVSMLDEDEDELLVEQIPDNFKTAGYTTYVGHLEGFFAFGTDTLFCINIINTNNNE
jgi:hypothetical protein